MRWRERCRWFVAIARAVKYLHSCKPPILHRDMKLENVMLTSTSTASSEAKVLDLGLHMRGKYKSDWIEGSFYGGSIYNEIDSNGSVYYPNQMRQAAATGALLPLCRLCAASAPVLRSISRFQ